MSSILTGAELAKDLRGRGRRRASGPSRPVPDGAFVKEIDEFHGLNRHLFGEVA